MRFGVVGIMTEKIFVKALNLILDKDVLQIIK